MIGAFIGLAVGLSIGLILTGLNGSLEYERGFNAGRLRGARETRWTAR